MSVLQQLKATSASAIDLRAFNQAFWMWYHQHEDDVILKRKILFFSVTIRVRDLRSVFVQIFGEEGQP